MHEYYRGLLEQHFLRGVPMVVALIHIGVGIGGQHGSGEQCLIRAFRIPGLLPGHVHLGPTLLNGYHTLHQM